MRSRAGWIATGLALLALATPGAAFARTAMQFYEDGNRLFKDDLYWAALLRYRQAANAGMDSPLLHYNSGVAHYKAGQHIRARESFLKSARVVDLQPISHYNLGLNAWKSGDLNEALRWFRQARDQDMSPEIRKLAIRAIRRLQNDSRVEEPIMVRAARAEKKPDLFRFDWHASLGGGVDSNVYRSPEDPYIDASDPNNPVAVTPEVQSGFYIPYSVNAKYSVQSFEHESFFAGYRLSGRSYQDEALQNGDEFSHELAIGTEYDRKKENSRRQIYSSFTWAQHNELYYDRDNGGEIIINGEDITDRFNYHRYGPEFWFRQSFKKFSFGFRGKAQLWNYENTVEVPEYDHEYFLLGLNTQYRFSRTSLIRFRAEAYQRNFGQRPSFELDGTQLVGNPPVEYTYYEFGVTARQRVGDSMWFGLEYEFTQRNDEYLGYNDYIRNSFGGEIHWRIGDRFAIKADGHYNLYDYGNAFAYHNPAVGRKTYESAFARVFATFSMTRNLSLVAEYRMGDTVSNDARIAYDRNEISLGVVWASQ